MMGLMPGGMFGLRVPPMAEPQDVAPAAAFTWAGGGARLSPEEVALRRRQIAEQRSAGLDYSPVGHWTQGLARVANGFLAGRDQRELEADMRASKDARGQIVSALTGASAPGRDVVTAALSDPDPAVRQIGEAVWERQNPKAPALTEFERMVAAAGYQPGTPEYVELMRQAVTNRANPMQAVPGVDENGNQVLRFIRPNMQEGGGQASPIGGGVTPPPTLPPDFDFGDGGPTQPASAPFR